MTNSDNSLSQTSAKINKTIYLIIVVSLIGLLDAVFLTVKHFSGDISCSLITGCQEVLSSPYSLIFGIPVALFGSIYYFIILISALIYIEQKKTLMLKIISYLPIAGFFFTLYLLYLMFFVIYAICQYCLLSALTSTLLLIFGLMIKNKK